MSVVAAPLPRCICRRGPPRCASPPSRSQMRLATAPVFHPSEFARQRITTETVKGAVAQILAQQSEGSPLPTCTGQLSFFPCSAHGSVRSAA